MAMNIGTRSGDVIPEMNTTPLIDVMLVLLTLLIVTLPLQTHAVKIDLPHGTPPSAPPPQVDTIGVDFDGAITWNGKVVDRATLDSYLANAAKEDPQPELHVQPDRLAKYNTIAIVLADAQRLGVKKIGFAREEQY
jgi:biopolymer transport protein ExbD